MKIPPFPDLKSSSDFFTSAPCCTRPVRSKLAGLTDGFIIGKKGGAGKKIKSKSPPRKDVSLVDGGEMDGISEKQKFSFKPKLPDYERLFKREKKRKVFF